MYQELKCNVSEQDGSVEIIAILAPGIPEQTAFFIERINQLKIENAKVTLDLDVAKATATITVSLPTASKLPTRPDHEFPGRPEGPEKPDLPDIKPPEKPERPDKPEEPEKPDRPGIKPPPPPGRPTPGRPQPRTR